VPWLRPGPSLVERGGPKRPAMRIDIQLEAEAPGVLDAAPRSLPVASCKQVGAQVGPLSCSRPGSLLSAGHCVRKAVASCDHAGAFAEDSVLK